MSRSVLKCGKSSLPSLTGSGWIKLYSLVLPGSVLNCFCDSFDFLEAGVQMCRIARFRRKKGSGRRPEIRPGVAKMGKSRKIPRLGCPESSKNGVRAEDAIGDF